MKNIVLLVINFLLLTSCASSDVYRQRALNTKLLTTGIAVNSYGAIEFISEKSRCLMAGLYADYKDIRDDFIKAKEWDSISKPVSLKKKINTYTSCKITMIYHYDKSSDTSFVNVCFQNPIYSKLIDIHCVAFNEYDRVISSINNAPNIIQELNNEIKASEALK